MPQYDRYHGAVKTALIKDGWMITDDPFTIAFGTFTLFADLGAEKVLSDQTIHAIVVEVKVFGGASFITELRKTLGQYELYRFFLEDEYPDYQIFLAISTKTYQDFFLRPEVQAVCQHFDIDLILFDAQAEEIRQWIT